MTLQFHTLLAVTPGSGECQPLPGRDKDPQALTGISVLMAEGVTMVLHSH
jgi:hypothetical protein